MDELAQWKVVGTVPEVYEAVFVPAVAGIWASQLVGLAKPKPDDRVLDVACGTGAVTCLFADVIGQDGQIVGYDINPEMLEIARAKRSAFNIEWRLGDVLALPFPDSWFDIVTCQLGLAFFEDRIKGLQEMYRVLKRGGKLLVIVWGPMEANPVFQATAAGFEKYDCDEAVESIRGFSVLGDFRELRSLAEAAGFEDIEVNAIAAQSHFPSVENLVHGIGALLQVSMGVAAQQGLISEVASILRPYVNNEGLIAPMGAILMKGQK